MAQDLLTQTMRILAVDIGILSEQLKDIDNGRAQFTNSGGRATVYNIYVQLPKALFS